MVKVTLVDFKFRSSSHVGLVDSRADEQMDKPDPGGGRTTLRLVPAQDLGHGEFLWFLGTGPL